MNLERASSIFNGKYTISSPRGGHKTFRIHTAKRGGMKGKRILSLLTGSDNIGDYTGFAFVDDSGIQVWNKKRGESKPSAWEIYAAMIWDMAMEEERSRYYLTGYRLYVSARCLRCNKELTTPESIKIGIGNTCLKKMS